MRVWRRKKSNHCCWVQRHARLGSEECQTPWHVQALITRESPREPEMNARAQQLNCLRFQSHERGFWFRSSVA